MFTLAEAIVETGVQLTFAVMHSLFAYLLLESNGLFSEGFFCE